ncbi:hypothetical protein, variant 1 [Aphanomyces astaci]|uniref:PX domain-containing protein n=1 Tax=Aphanomyces astaci TaxID=112090 RepID=W4FVB2_APHAT|nr:hypothetical protein, variant 2 [Aphanomyces astaci]XP_009839938.1 hypothetical protein, variant 1 [Aphanomyces astaci]ETV70553.1 hypothetical protein, variant 1 [Aphanomyces astaci]ETV70554.1 hypothetical protein, variant 2 [Aphanomyces astaci]|eukprot:XP_009839935.1 hypothetical protein, variant 2 [Aphanomyces astaci]
MATHASYAMSEEYVPQHQGGKYSATNAKKRLVRKIQQDSLKQLSLATQAVLVRSPTEPYHSYHMTITSEYYKQKWIACHRYSDFYRLRKTVLEVLSVHARMGCPVCQTVHAQVKKFDFPPRDIFRRGELDKQVAMRLPMLEDFVVALCQYLSTEGLLVHCRNILTVQNKVVVHGILRYHHHCINNLYFSIFDPECACIMQCLIASDIVSTCADERFYAVSTRA